MVRRWLSWSGVLLLAGVLLVAPPASAQGPATSSEAALSDFMKAVADSNLKGMAALWGTQKGSAAKTKAPPDYERRLLIMHAYLRGNSYRVAATQTEENADKRNMLVEFSRNGCNKVAQVRTVKSRNEGWLVNFIDLSAVGGPGQSCGAVSADSAPTGS